MSSWAILLSPQRIGIQAIIPTMFSRKKILSMRDTNLTERKVFPIQKYFASIEMVIT